MHSWNKYCKIPFVLIVHLDEMVIASCIYNNNLVRKENLTNYEQVER